MGIFNRKKQNPDKEIMNESDAIKKARKYANADQNYILLSIMQADMKNGYSTPYIGAMSNGHKILFLFSTYELAEKFVDFHGYEKLDGIYPIGLIEKTHKYNNLKSICNLALYLGVNYIDFDNVEKADVFGCEINWFMKINNIPFEPISMILSAEEYNRIVDENDAKIKSHMNPMPIVDFTNPYLISEKRSKEILLHIFKEGTVDERIDIFNNKQSLSENCYIMDTVATKMLPQAIEEGRQNEIEFFGEVIESLSLVIKEKVAKSHTLFTLKESNSNNIYIKNGSAYLLYTDRFKYMGHFNYVKLNGISDFLKLIANSSIERVVVTDGPDSIAVLKAKMFLDNNP